MTGQQLKNSILQLAIQGKLVPQIESEGTAEDLLKEIRAEKEKLVKEGKLKKKDLEVKPIEDDEIPFEIPESWKWCRLGYILKTTSGSTPLTSNSAYYNGDVNWTRTTDLNNGYLSSCEKKVSLLAVSECNLSIIPRNSICIAMYGGAGTIGKYSLIKFDTTINQSVCAIHPNEKIYMEFIYYFMQYQRPLWMDFAVGSRKDPNINKIIINNCMIPLPPLSEQKRIVAKIEELMPMVEEYGKAQERLETLNRELPEKLKKSVLQEAIMGKLVPQDPSEGTAEELVKILKKKQLQLSNEKKIKVGKYNKEIIQTDLPQGWCNIKLGDISSLITKQTGFDYSNTIKPNLVEVKIDGSIPMIQTKNFKGKSFDFDTDYYIPLKVAERFPNIMLKEKCMLLSIVGASVGNVGIYDEDRLGIIGGAICKVVLLDESLYDYVYYFLKSPQGHDEIRKNFKSTAQGTITVQDVREIQIPLPPLSEQKRIVAKLEEVMGKIENMMI